MLASMGGILPGQPVEMACGPDVYCLRVMVHIPFVRGNRSPRGVGQTGSKRVAGQLQKVCENIEIK